MKMLALAYFYAASMQDKWLKFLQFLMMTRTEGWKGTGRMGKAPARTSRTAGRWQQLVFDMCTWPAISS